mmetsp:Transcript_69326/g.208052  ORF Transcript_69326/g.208052 Transcript_69326/m.208052 type:complete len:226 (+) Transcript_69326:402-1079(+)
MFRVISPFHLPCPFLRPQVSSHAWKTFLMVFKGPLWPLGSSPLTRASSSVMITSRSSQPKHIGLHLPFIACTSEHCVRKHPHQEMLNASSPETLRSDAELVGTSSSSHASHAHNGVSANCGIEGAHVSVTDSHCLSIRAHPFYGPLPRYRKCAHRRSRPPRSLEHEACPRARTRFAGSCPSRFARSTHQRRQRRFRQTVCAFERHKSTSPAHTGRISCRTTARSA